MSLTMVYMVGGNQLALAEDVRTFSDKLFGNSFIAAVDAVTSIAWQLNVNEITMFRPGLPQEQEGVLQMRAQNSGIAIPGVEIPRR